MDIWSQAVGAKIKVKDWQKYKNILTYLPLLNYKVYDREIFTGCQASYGGPKSGTNVKELVLSVNYGPAKSKYAQIACL